MKSSLKRIGAVVAARSNSRRLPNKAIMPLNGKPMILFLLQRLSKSRLIDELIVATTNKSSDNQLANLITTNGFKVFRGDENNLVKRYVDVANLYSLDYVIRVTGDCPLVDSVTMDFCIGKIIKKCPLIWQLQKVFSQLV